MVDYAINVYLNITKHAHTAYLDYLNNLSEDVLEWKINEFSKTIKEILMHILNHQTWFLNEIFNIQNEQKKQFHELNIEQLITKTKKMLESNEQKIAQLKNEDLQREVSVKEYTMNISELLHEYIYHLNHHTGQIAQIVQAKKRYSRVHFADES